MHALALLITQDRGLIKSAVESSEVGTAFGSSVQCAISREALDDHFGTDGVDNTGRVEAFQKSRSKIERLVRRKYLSWRPEEPEYVLLKTMDVEQLSNSNQ